MKTGFTVTLPEQAMPLLEMYSGRKLNDREAMELAIALSMGNVENKTGGPFGTVITDFEGNIVGIGVNRVVPCGCSLAHGEMTAIGIAQASVGNFDLGADGAVLTLYTSAAPCAMCVGGIVWSGVRRLFCAATSDDVESLVGFDEGPIHPDWENQLRARDILVVTEFMREEAREVLQAYVDNGGFVYNSRK